MSGVYDFERFKQHFIPFFRLRIFVRPRRALAQLNATRNLNAAFAPWDTLDNFVNKVIYTSVFTKSVHTLTYLVLEYFIIEDNPRSFLHTFFHLHHPYVFKKKWKKNFIPSIKVLLRTMDFA